MILFSVEYDFNSPHGGFIQHKEDYYRPVEVGDNVIFYYHPESEDDEGFGTVVTVTHKEQAADPNYWRFRTDYLERVLRKSVQES